MNSSRASEVQQRLTPRSHVSNDSTVDFNFSICNQNIGPFDSRNMSITSAMAFHEMMGVGPGDPVLGVSPSQGSLNSSGYNDDYSSHNGRLSDCSMSRVNPGSNARETSINSSSKKSQMSSSMITNNSKTPSESSKGSRRSRKKLQEETDSTVYEINPFLIREMGKTTLMIKNIPNKYSKSMMKQLINKSFKDKYDFFYLPIDLPVTKRHRTSFLSSFLFIFLVSFISSLFSLFFAFLWHFFVFLPTFLSFQFSFCFESEKMQHGICLHQLPVPGRCRAVLQGAQREKVGKLLEPKSKRLRSSLEMLRGFFGSSRSATSLMPGSKEKKKYQSTSRNLGSCPKT